MILSWRGAMDGASGGTVSETRREACLFGAAELRVVGDLRTVAGSIALQSAMPSNPVWGAPRRRGGTTDSRQWPGARHSLVRTGEDAPRVRFPDPSRCWRRAVASGSGRLLPPREGFQCPDSVGVRCGSLISALVKEARRRRVGGRGVEREDTMPPPLLTGSAPFDAVQQKDMPRRWRSLPFCHGGPGNVVLRLPQEAALPIGLL